MEKKIICTSCKAPVNKPLKEEQFICEYCGALNRVNSKIRTEDTFKQLPKKKSSILFLIFLGILAFILMVITVLI